MRSFIASVSVFLLTAGLLLSPFVHAHVHSDPEAASVVHVHWPEGAPDAHSPEESIAGTGHGDPLELFLLVPAKAPLSMALPAELLSDGAPVWTVTRSPVTGSPVRARDPASSTPSSRAPPA